MPTPEGPVASQIHALAAHLLAVSAADALDGAVSTAEGHGGAVAAVAAVAAAVRAAVEAHPHRVAWEDGCESRTYLQIYRHLEELGWLLTDVLFLNMFDLSICSRGVELGDSEMMKSPMTQYWNGLWNKMNN